jgi:hypothetical protein
MTVWPGVSVLRRHDRGLVHEDLAGAEAALGGEEDVAAVLEARSERAEGVEVRVQAPPADDVAAWRRHVRMPETRQQGPGEQERGADALGVPAVDVRLAVDARGAQDDLVVVPPLGAHADAAEHPQHRVDVADARHVAHHDLLGGQHRGGEDRKGTVLVAGRDHRAAQRNAAVDDELLHEGARLEGGVQALG